jgi:uncharacterized membrane protein
MRYDRGIGCPAIFILVMKVTVDEFCTVLQPFKGKGKVIRASLAKDEEDGLRAFIKAHPEAASASCGRRFRMHSHPSTNGEHCNQ